MMQDEIMVTIYCLAYNHERYIRKALDSFLMQKTNFGFEIIIHDDASTDNTAKIIAEYVNRYPQLIKPIYQKENQYSKHVRIFKDYILPLARGKYYAICEGDDYWLDENKLQKQVYYLEEHDDCVACVHAGKYINEDGSDRGDLFRAYNYNANVKIEDAIVKWLVPTASFLYRSEYAIIPTEITSKYMGDVPRMLFLLTKGNVYYMDEVMSAYRVNSISSVSRIAANEDSTEQKNRLDSLVDYYNRFNKYTNGKYDSAIKQRVRLLSYNYCLKEWDYEQLKSTFLDLYIKLPLCSKVKFYLLKKHPKIASALRKMKRRIK